MSGDSHGSRIAALLLTTGLSALVQTVYVERVHLTLRHSVGPLRRRIWAITRSLQQFRWHVEWGCAYLHFCRLHAGLRVEIGSGRYRQRTPAMAAGVTRRPWSVRELLLRPVYAL